jgi:hypothetical protein
MHLIVLVSELKTGQRVVTLNNKRVYVSTAPGLLEPASDTWLRSTPPEGAKVQGCAFNCGSLKEAPERAMDF